LMLSVICWNLVLTKIKQAIAAIPLKKKCFRTAC
jgi:hypothetical protein